MVSDGSAGSDIVVVAEETVMTCDSAELDGKNELIST